MRIGRIVFITVLGAVAAVLGAVTLVSVTSAGAGPGTPLALVVTTTEDVGAVSLDGSCSDPCSLREAVLEAANNAEGGTITFAVDGIFSLDGQIRPQGSGSVTIVGNGVDKTILESDPMDVQSFRGDFPPGRHFAVVGTDLSLQMMTLRDGSANDGGSILVLDGGSLTTDDVHFVDNVATFGGAIAAEAGNDTVEINRTTFTGNEAENGGAIYVGRDQAEVTNSTFTNNTAQYGSAIYVLSLGTLTVDYSTFSQNTVGAEERGAGANEAPPYQSFRSKAAVPSGLQRLQGSIVGEEYETNVADVTIGHSILEKTTGESTDECNGPIQSSGANVVDDDSCAFSEALDVEGVAANVGALGDNGGATFTMALTVASAAVDVDPALCKLNDQRDLPRNVDGDEDGTAACDSGAYELQVTPVDPTTSTTTTTSPDGDVDADTATAATPTVAQPTFTG